MKAFPTMGFLSLALVVSATSCTPTFDQITLDHLQAIRRTPVVPADSCTAFVAYEQSKLDQKSPMGDKHSRRNVDKACECVATAGTDTSSIVRRSCTTMIGGFEVYENEKKSKNQ